MTVCVCGEGGVWELTLVLNDLIERHPPAPLHLLPHLPRARGRQRQRSSERRDPRHHRRGNLLSGWHKGEVRGQISAVRRSCFLMVMPSQTSLRHSRRARRTGWRRFMNMTLNIKTDNLTGSVRQRQTTVDQRILQFHHQNSKHFCESYL